MGTLLCNVDLGINNFSLSYPQINSMHGSRTREKDNREPQRHPPFQELLHEEKYPVTNDLTAEVNASKRVLLHTNVEVIEKIKQRLHMTDKW